MAFQTLPDGTEIFFESQGRGNEIIFVHGVWASSGFFKKQLGPLSLKYRVTALDLRGHGQSSKTPRGHTVLQYAHDLRSFLDATSSENVVLIGWSMGAFVIWQYLRHYGTQGVRGVVFVDQSASDFRWSDWEYGVVDLEGLRGIMNAVQVNQRELATGFVTSMLKETPSETDVKFMVDEMCRVPESIAGCIFFDQALHDYREELDCVKVPTLLCFGRESKPFPVEAGQDLLQRLPDGRLVVFENSGHCPFWEEPSRFNLEVDNFVSSL
jgi:pimeloyl-ACP methyl ester carboxylesterase